MSDSPKWLFYLPTEWIWMKNFLQWIICINIFLFVIASSGYKVPFHCFNLSQHQKYIKDLAISDSSDSIFTWFFLFSNFRVELGQIIKLAAKANFQSHQCSAVVVEGGSHAVSKCKHHFYFAFHRKYGRWDKFSLVAIVC